MFFFVCVTLRAEGLASVSDGAIWPPAGLHEEGGIWSGCVVGERGEVLPYIKLGCVQSPTDNIAFGGAERVPKQTAVLSESLRRQVSAGQKPLAVQSAPF